MAGCRGVHKCNPTGVDKRILPGAESGQRGLQLQRWMSSSQRTFYIISNPEVGGRFMGWNRDDEMFDGGCQVRVPAFQSRVHFISLIFPPKKSKYARVQYIKAVTVIIANSREFNSISIASFVSQWISFSSSRRNGESLSASNVNTAFGLTTWPAISKALSIDYRPKKPPGSSMKWNWLPSVKTLQISSRSKRWTNPYRS